MKSGTDILNAYCINKKIAVAVSGGIDSMCLLHLVLNNKNIDKNNVTVVHINHNLRGNNSDADANFVRDFCSAAKVSFLCKSEDILSLSRATGHSIELAARLKRREVFTALKSTAAVDFVLTAHHALDNAETLLYRVFRGTGISGLKCMPVLTDNYILRPLINTGKNVILEYAKQHNICYVTDSTNGQNEYDRNYIRNQIMPLIQARWNIEESAKTLIQNAREDDEYITQDIKNVAHCGEIDICNLTHKAVAVRIINSALKQLDMHDITSALINNIYNLKDSQTGKYVSVNKNYNAVRQYGKIVFVLKKQKKENEQKPFKIGQTEFDNAVICVSNSDKTVQKGQIKLDLNAIPQDAVFRYKQTGDMFKPYNGKQTTLKKYLVNQKIPLQNRDKLILLASGNIVIAILDIQISDNCKIVSNTKNAVIIDVSA